MARKHTHMYIHIRPHLHFIPHVLSRFLSFFLIEYDIFDTRHFVRVFCYHFTSLL